MKRLFVFAALVLVFFFQSCEETIDLDFQDNDPVIVVEAELSNLSNQQEIRVNKTKSIFESGRFVYVEDAHVVVSTSKGQSFQFIHQGEGKYTHSNFIPQQGVEYSLSVLSEGQRITAKSTMQAYVEVDSLGFIEENILDQSYDFVAIRFLDPNDEENYYKYTMSVNDKPAKFMAVFSDKLNNGRDVEHRFYDADNDFYQGDKVVVYRSLISKEVFRYWNEYQRLTPSSSAPSNPTSNLSGGALGYFSINNTKRYTLEYTNMRQE